MTNFDPFRAPTIAPPNGGALLPSTFYLLPSDLLPSRRLGTFIIVSPEGTTHDEIVRSSIGRHRDGMMTATRQGSAS